MSQFPFRFFTVGVVSLVLSSEYCSAQSGSTNPADIQKEIEKYFEKHPLPQAQPPSSPGSTLKLLDLSFIALNDFSTSTSTLDEFRSLQYGGHDPKNLGFTAANEELALSGIVDPYFRGDAFIVFLIDEDGESQVELEEAVLTTLALPYGFQARAGQMFNSFGRQNSQHPHSWGFADQPVILSRMFGPDGLRGPGMELSYSLPTPFFAELVFGAQNAFGETVTSFGHASGETFAGRTLGSSKQRSLADLLYLAKLKTSFDLDDEWTLVTGVSSLFGPNSSGYGPGSNGESQRTAIYGADLYLKWKPLDAEQGWPFVSLQSEVMTRRYEAGVDTAASLPETTLHDWGHYTQILWGFQRGWAAGFRYDYARGSNGDGDFLRDRRVRFSPDLTYYPSEFSKIRLQYNYDRADFLSEPSHSLILQFEIGFGAHGAHKF